MRTRRRVVGGLFVVVFVAFMAMQPTAHADVACQYFPQTQHKVCGVFLTYWQTHGGLAQQGYPLSDMFDEQNQPPPAGDGKSHPVQYFERARFEAHPENRPPYNVLLGLLGAEQLHSKYASGTPSSTPRTGETCQTFVETGFSACGQFLSYWLSHGGLAQQGFPISAPFDEQNQPPPAGDGKSHRVQYFERARFEEHAENQPPYNTLLGLLGSEQFGAKYANGAPFSAAQVIGSFTPDPNGKYGGTATYGFAGLGTASLNPYFAENTATATLTGLLYAPMVGVNSEGKYYPYLLSDIPTIQNGGVTVQNGGADITLRLKPNLRWSDGTALTSADIAFTFRWIVDPGQTDMQADVKLYQNISGVDTPDAQTAIVHLRQTYGGYLDVLNIEPMPQHVFAQIPINNSLVYNDAVTAPTVVSGPFRFVSGGYNQTIRLARNSQFAAVWGRNAYLDNIVFVPTTHSDAVGRLNRGEIDALEGILPINVEQVGRAFNVDKQTNYNYEVLELNYTDPILQDTAVRKALDFALDRLALSKLSPTTSNYPLTAPIVSASFAYRPASQITGQRINEARQALDQAGWSEGGDGIRSKNGTRLSLTITTNNDNTGRLTVESVIQGYARQVGIDLRTQNYAFNQLVRSYDEGGILATGQFQVALIGWSSGTPDPDGLYSLLHSSQITSANNKTGLNEARINDPMLDNLLDKQRQEMDIATRLGIWRDFQTAYQEAKDELPLYSGGWISAYNNRIANYKSNPASGHDQWNAMEWYIK